MKLLIIGSRSITNLDLSPYIPQDTQLIISGGANGIDTLAEQYADKHRISKCAQIGCCIKQTKVLPYKIVYETTCLTDWI